MEVLDDGPRVEDELGQPREQCRIGVDPRRFRSGRLAVEIHRTFDYKIIEIKLMVYTGPFIL